MTVTPWLASYPFSDPYFQNFNVQQYLTVSGVNPSQTYSLEAPEEEKGEATPPEEQAIEAGESPESPKITPVDQPPKRSASQAEWAAYAVSRGTPEDMAATMSRTQLIALIDSGHPDDAVAGVIPEDAQAGGKDEPARQTADGAQPSVDPARGPEAVTDSPETPADHAVLDDMGATAQDNAVPEQHTEIEDK